jgi:hypothetical protein
MKRYWFYMQSCCQASDRRQRSVLPVGRVAEALSRCPSSQIQYDLPPSPLRSMCTTRGGPRRSITFESLTPHGPHAFHVDQRPFALPKVVRELFLVQSGRSSRNKSGRGSRTRLQQWNLSIILPPRTHSHTPTRRPPLCTGTRCNHMVI